MKTFTSNWPDKPIATDGFDREHLQEYVDRGCSNCGSSHLTVRFGIKSNGSNMFRLLCERCGLANIELRQLVTRPATGDFTMPIGAHAGKPLKEISRTYLEWCTKNFTGKNRKLGMKIRAFLDNV